MMTTTTQPTAADEAPQSRAVGHVAQIIGPVVVVEFAADQMPEIYNALETDVELPEEAGGSRTLTFEVEQHIGDGLVKAISMQPTDGLVRGTPVRDTGESISVPVGDVVKGHVFNALGKPLDIDEAKLDLTERLPIHRKPPAFDQLEGSTQMMETGIKVRSEEHTSELQSHSDLVCRLLL